MHFQNECHETVNLVWNVLLVTVKDLELETEVVATLTSLDAETLLLSIVNVIAVI